METISHWMQQDHVEIDAIAESALAAAGARDLATLASEGGRFLERLGRHIEMEERVLFAAFEERTGMTAAGPSVQMRVEHDQMRPILDSMQAALAARDGAAWQQAARSLHEILVPHNLKEEQMMYPMLDRAMGPDAESLLADVRAMAL